MGFLGVYKAIYDYTPQSEGELTINEGDLLYVLEKSAEDDWWKAKKKASPDEEEEPVGLIPNNYIEEVPAVCQARALYEYERQTDEELSFPEDAQLEVFDTSDPDWILVGLEGDYGFVPANYIEVGEDTAEKAVQDGAEPAPPSLPSRPLGDTNEAQSPPLPDRRTSVTSEDGPAAPNPAAALAGLMQGRQSGRGASPPPPITVPSRQQYSSEVSEDEPSPALPTRPRSQSARSTEHSVASPVPQRMSPRNYEDDAAQHSPIAPGGFHMYNINEMVSVMGKKKKMPTTLGINLKTGVILIAPEKTKDGPTQEWSADKMTHYSREGKHVFLELVRPSKSIDFHAGAKDTAEDIVSALGELAGAIRAEGLREVIMAGTGQNTTKRGQILYDFMSQGDDEVTVAVGDEVIIIDDTKSDEWWQVRRLKTGKEGVVPSSYIDVTDSTKSPAVSGVNAGKSSVAQNRLEEERLTKEAVRRDQARAAEVGPGMRLPERNSSLLAGDNGNQSTQQRSKKENGRLGSSKSKPDPSKVRTWTDRSKSFSVEAQFLGLKDNKINLHKMNGVKIAVPIAKMSVEDLEYVERAMGISLDEDKPLSEVKRARAAKAGSAPAKVGASVEPTYDWFQFFLSCEVAVGLCERYAQAFAKDSMDESVLPDVDAGVLRNLGLREGDIIKVMRHLDKKFGREGKKRNANLADNEDGENETASGGLFSGPGGTLRNNTRKGRPAPTVQTNDVVDAKAFSQQKDSGADIKDASSSPSEKPHVKAKESGGFDDDAWDVKPARQPSQTTAKSAPSPEPKTATSATQGQPPQNLTGSLAELSLLAQPLQPTKVHPTTTPPMEAPQPPVQPSTPSHPVSTQPQGATPSFFTGLNAQAASAQIPQPTAQAPLNLGLGGARQRPSAPQANQSQGALILPPMSRPLSAPQSAQPSAFAPPPLQPQITGIAPPGQSLNELNQQRYQPQFIGGFQAQPTGQSAMPQYSQVTGLQQQPGFGIGQFMQPAMTGAPQVPSPFSDPRGRQFSPIQTQPTGFPAPFNPAQLPPTGSVNSYLPPALEPQRTGMPAMQPQATGFGGPGHNFTNGMNNIAQQQQQPQVAPLVPQQTGPPPSVRFGVTENKLTPQATGRRANLSQATPQNPFGF